VSSKEPANAAERIARARRRAPAVNAAEFVPAKDSESGRRGRLKPVRASVTLFAQNRVLDPIPVPHAAYGAARAKAVVVQVPVDVHRASAAVATVVMRRQRESRYLKNRAGFRASTLHGSSMARLMT
jgi:hypothetical protein